MMLRRHAIATLFAAAGARAQDRLAPLFEGVHGTALLIDAATLRAIAVHAPDLAGRLLVPPGSTLKPFSISALLDAGKLRPFDTFRCPGALTIAGRNLSCSHPRDLPPMQARTAIAYSCNCFVAHYAAQFEAGELMRSLLRYRLFLPTELVAKEAAGEPGQGDVRLQALGEDGVVTPAGLAVAYQRLVVACRRVSMGPILGGLEDAVAFGTAQRARVDGLKVAGKTGSTRGSDGTYLAWFAGFAPSTAPKYVLVAMVQGRSGGADAAPIAGRILEAAWRGRVG
jgi:cell division protein FtsI/penicillin-binding protein 2